MTAARTEPADDLGPARRTGFHHGVENRVDRLLVEGVRIAERIQVEFQRFALDALFVRHVPHDDVPEVRLAGHRAERGVFRAVELDDVVAVGVDVLKRLKPRGVGGVRIVAFRGRQQRQVAEPFPVLFGVHIGPVL